MRTMFFAAPALLLAVLSALGQATQGGETLEYRKWSALIRSANELTAAGNYARARAELLSALSLAERFGESDFRLALTLNNLGGTYQDLQRYGDAERSYRRAMRIWEHSSPSGVAAHPEMAKAWNGLAAVCERRGNYSEALQLYARAAEVWESTLGPNHPDLAIGLNNLGCLYRTCHRYSEAVASLERAIRILENSRGPQDCLMVFSLVNLAAVHTRSGQTEASMALLARAVPRAEQAFGSEHPVYAEVLKHYAVALRKGGKKQEAAQVMKRAKTILQAHASRDFSAQAVHTSELLRK